MCISITLPYLDVSRFPNLHGIGAREFNLSGKSVKTFGMVQQYVLREYIGMDLEIISRFLQRVKKRIKRAERVKRG